MAAYQFFKELTLPTTLQPNSIYFVASGTDKMEMHVTGTTASVVRRIQTEADVQALINASLVGMSTLDVVADIAARNALTPSANKLVLVEDATGDTTVASGAATYIYKQATTSWVKISEFESLDLILSWGSIIGRPTSTVAAIDLAVTNSHTHTNSTVVAALGTDGSGNLTYNGNTLQVWASTAW